MFKRIAFVALLATPVLAGAQKTIGSYPSLGMAEGRCRPGETGPSFIINVVGLKDRGGTIKVELYPATDADFLADDNKLIAAGKAFRRQVIDVPKQGPVSLCIRAPGAGAWALSLLHDRDNNRKFGLSIDGTGFPANPDKLGPVKPKVALGRTVARAGPTPITVRMLYRRGLLSFGPVR